MQNSTITGCLALSLLLAACASPPLHSAASLPSNGACIGTVISPPAGMLRETSDDKLLQSAVNKPGAGGLCTGKVFIAVKPITVYRLWDKSKSWSALGGWWSLSYPQGSRDDYRKQNDICKEWSALDMLNACTLKAGAKIVIGPGQSVNTCEDKIPLPPSPLNQAYIPKDTQGNLSEVENCDSAAWQGN